MYAALFYRCFCLSTLFTARELTSRLQQANPVHPLKWKGKGSPYSITECGVPELIPGLGSQPAVDVSHKPGGRLPLLCTRPVVTPATLKRAATSFAAWWTEAQWVWTVCLRLLPDSGSCDLNPGPSAPESSTLTTRLPSHPFTHYPVIWWT